MGAPRIGGGDRASAGGQPTPARAWAEDGAQVRRRQGAHSAIVHIVRGIRGVSAMSICRSMVCGARTWGDRGVCTRRGRAREDGGAQGGLGDGGGREKTCEASGQSSAERSMALGSESVMSEIPEKWDQLPSMATPSATRALAVRHQTSELITFNNI